MKKYKTSLAQRLKNRKAKTKLPTFHATNRQENTKLPTVYDSQSSKHYEDDDSDMDKPIILIASKRKKLVF